VSVDELIEHLQLISQAGGGGNRVWVNYPDEEGSYPLSSVTPSDYQLSVFLS
jgi:hypothetical protein